MRHRKNSVVYRRGGGENARARTKGGRARTKDMSALARKAVEARKSSRQKREDMRTPLAECLIKGCSRAHYARGLCRLHYRRLRREPNAGLDIVAGYRDGGPPRTHDVRGRVTDAAIEKLQRGVDMKKARTLHDLITRLAESYDPDKDAGPQPQRKVDEPPES